MYADLNPSESELIGNWIESSGEVVADETDARIEWLVTHRLEPILVDASNWDMLCRDPADGRLWERTFPHNEWHGGGPPRLAIISADDAAKKYKALSIIAGS